MLRRSRCRRFSPSFDERKSTAVLAAAANAGGGAVEKINERARLMSHSVMFRDPQSSRAHAERFAKRSHLNIDFPAQVFFESQASPISPDHSDSVRFIEK